MMELKVEPGKYVIAVSGGVDSVVLLDILSRDSELDLIVAHFDHGIREKSIDDRIFVQVLANKYGFQFEYLREELGANSSEAKARERRYRFLNSIIEKHSADALITAHHKDDVLETALINLSRGTGRRGLTSLSSGKVVRPMLQVTKAEIIEYANSNDLQWREDETNSEDKYLRNIIRARLVHADKVFLEELNTIIEENIERNAQIDEILESIFNSIFNKESCEVSRSFFIQLPYKVSCEFLAYWLRKYSIDFDKKHIELLTVSLKTGLNGKKFDAGSGTYFYLTDKVIRLERVSSV